MKDIEYMREISEKFKAYYDMSFNIRMFNKDFEMFAKFNNRTVKYLLTRKNEIDAFENNEYIFYKNIKSLSSEYIHGIREFINKNVEDIVNVSNEHMSSIITFVLCGDIQLDEDTKKAIKKFKYYKSFFLGLKGWVNVKMVFINPMTREIYTNKFGKEDSKRFMLESKN